MNLYDDFNLLCRYARSYILHLFDSVLLFIDFHGEIYAFNLYTASELF